MSDYKATQLSNIQLNDYIIWSISHCLISTNWVAVGRQLKISDANLDEIKLKYHGDSRECSYRMLILWRETYPKTTLQNLITALQSLNQDGIVTDITQCLSKEVKHLSLPSAIQPNEGTSTKTLGKITIYDDDIVGHGGHNTIVYKYLQNHIKDANNPYLGNLDVSPMIQTLEVCMTPCSLPEITYLIRGRYEGREAAIKKVPREFVSLVDTEIKTLIHADGHPHIIRYFGKEEDVSHFYIALELCQFNLETYCKSDYKTIRDQKDDKCLLREITEGLAYLHAAGTIHRDIKPENILISQPNIMGHIKAVISDFGYSKKLPLGKASTSQSAKKGTSGWMATEVVRNTGKVTDAIDVFSLGCVFYYVISNGKQMFYSDYDVEQRIPDMGHLKSDRHILIKTLIEKMINRNPKQRPSCKEVLESIFFWDAKDVLQFIKNVEELLSSGQVQDEKQTNLEKDSFEILNANLGEKSPPPFVKHENFTTVRQLIQYISKIIQKTDESMEHFNKILLKFPKLFQHVHNLFGNYKPEYSLRPRLGSESFRKIQPKPDPELSSSLTPTQRKRSTPFSPVLPTIPARWRPPLKHTTSGEVEEIFAVDAHAERIQHVIFSNNGRMIATCSTDKCLKVWKPGNSDVQYVKNMRDVNWKQINSSQFNNDDTALLVCGVNNKNHGQVTVFSIKDDLQEICCVKNDLVLTNAWQSDSCFVSCERTEIQNENIHEISLNNLPKNKLLAAPSTRVWTYYTDEDVKTVAIMQTMKEIDSKKRGSGYDECFGYLVYNTRNSIGVKSFMLSYANFAKTPRGSASLKTKPQFDKPDMLIPCQGEICNITVLTSQSQRQIYAVTKSPSQGYQILSFELASKDYKTTVFEVAREYQMSRGSSWIIGVSRSFLVSATKGSASLFIWDRNDGKLQSKALFVGSVESAAINPADEMMLAIGNGREMRLWKIQDSDA